ncbi:hypothetical protein [Saccharothrix sp. ALI-22-I]|uniref:hypothetical protein n=1 Tax=Saccharothrix sp. ALI-22-I TaxID=1933778 RepID=UPI00117BDA7F|nr:hypothetical protein [Saccharothrix sp. ALI-22-I]
MRKTRNALAVLVTALSLLVAMFTAPQALAQPVVQPQALGSLYALSANKDAVWEWQGGQEWRKVGGPAADLYAGSAGVFATSPVNGDIFRYNGTPNDWTKVGGPGTTFAMSGRHLYGLSPNRSSVWEWQSGETWKQVWGPAHWIYGSTVGLFATAPGNGDIFRFNNTSWSKVGGPGKTFVANNSGLYGLRPDGSSVWHWTGGESWEYIGGAAGWLAGGAGALLATNPNSGDIFRWSGTGTDWYKIGGPGADFRVAANNRIFGLTPNKSGVWMHSSGETWVNVGGPAAAIAAV